MIGLFLSAACIVAVSVSITMDGLSRKRKRDERLCRVRERYGLDWNPSEYDERLLNERR